ncbi:uncharacterized protein OCT59_003338 [Rhizophagus irregularis]|uniref:Alpha/Beta hydrolase protein n=2 Tax=Rhizophagus irregularis TaxID=588596 RepID=U9U5Z8_RHIID|nr:Alpha/Beta hydrolase protein [Rhizophagus irregularis DAOM 181602=DAOM 197198]EXX70045.1 hypothetical protein RirG_090990 [Rhizophagus irregularis DAOM 197198w]UZO11782.1 hypothetical protein OCT59_003338 [Rhizophagus irregularis]POG70156.1 Alpha/Beta hydrolase protein [Rhizophagus irregularis DAOM 181602=DAOM 197198]CAG8736003.1 610_t:CDS:2 [Rhizophagus irregularis]GBC37256.1 alpha/beta hydrolase protein [Rhizophagus irregularis DAOM 181602=DAOM 197198]|eukprot:XP_025177022.1 Alpha/Beta hydrolase protein [Rhizophagus irregularis DAOM 181602=DAOM 197198]
MLAVIVLEILKRIPLIFSTIIKHFKHGPPQPSWDLKVHLIVSIAGTLGAPPYKKFTIEVAQSSIPIFTYKIPSDLKLYETSIPHEYRINAQAYIEKIVKPYNIVIDPIWKTPRNDEIKGELIMDKDWNEENDWEKEKIVLYLHGGAYSTGNSKIAHDFCCKLSRTSGARIFTISYRLAPQNPFPSALCDSLAAYLYLMNPPKDSGFKAYKPEQIVFGGDSAGGGLVVSLGLAIRDLGLPLPAGIVSWSPWTDLTHSMPSFNDTAVDETDFLPLLPGFKFARNTNSDAYREFRTRSGNIIRNIQKNPEIKIIGDESLKRIGNQSVSFYVVNEGLGIPYVSPMLAESLGGLPPLLIIAGNVERLRDEAVYLAYRASNPEKYRLPKYEVDFDNSRFKSPSKQVILEIYDEMFHNFHYSHLEAAKVTVRRASEFISTVIQEALQANPTSNKFETYKITYQGEVQNFDESSIEHVLTWDKAGVFPGV